MKREHFDSYIKEHYPQEISDLRISDEALNRIMQLNRNSPSTKVGKRILLSYVLVLLLLAISIPVTAYAAATIYSAVYEKVKNSGMTKDEISDLADVLEGLNYSADDIEAMEPVQRNEDGQSYGIDILNADLIAAVADNGKQGYVYRKDLEPEDFKNPEEAAEYSADRSAFRIKVYKKDGKAVIGYFTVGSGKNNDN